MKNRRKQAVLKGSRPGSYCQSSHSAKHLTNPHAVSVMFKYCGFCLLPIVHHCPCSFLAILSISGFMDESFQLPSAPFVASLSNSPRKATSQKEKHCRTKDLQKKTLKNKYSKLQAFSSLKIFSMSISSSSPPFSPPTAPASWRSKPSRAPRTGWPLCCRPRWCPEDRAFLAFFLRKKWWRNRGFLVV